MPDERWAWLPYRDRSHLWASPIRCLALRGGLLVTLILVAWFAAWGAARDDSRDEGGADEKRPRAFLVHVPLPIQGTVDTRVKQQVDRILAELPESEERPIVVFEFRAGREGSGEGSEFERCLSLARYLAGERWARVKTVAYVPQTVTGHAVLPVIACEQFIIHPDAELGDAGRDEPHIDATIRRGYAEIAERRRTVPVAVAVAMLDKDVTLYRVQTLDGVRYVLDDEIEQLKAQGDVSAVETLAAAGDRAIFSGKELRLTYGFASHLAANRRELAEALGVPRTALEEDPSGGAPWVAVRVDISGPIHGQLVNWVLRSLEERLRGGRVNLVCLYIDSPGGSITDTLRLAGYLAKLRPGEVRTVAFVPHEARSDAVLLALGCDHFVASEEAQLGGPGAVQLSSSQMPEIHRSIRALAAEKERDAALWMALIDPDVTVHRYTRRETGEVRYFTEEEVAELEDPSQWERGVAVEAADGITGSDAFELGLCRYLASDMGELRQLYHVEEELNTLQPNWAHMMIESLASPRIAGILLFIGWFALLMEFSQPGLGVAGFTSAVCFTLYFWSQFLHGTAGWLEVLLFLVGVACVLVEILVIPGFGIFGLGGGVLIISSIVLASQTFVIPQNEYQLEQLPSSLLMVAAGGAGAFASLAVVRKFLPDAPVLKRLMLVPPDEHEQEELARRESLVDYEYLVGKRGKTTTRLVPAGKAMFGDELVDVMSDGEWIPPRTDVVAVEVRGNVVYVEPLDSGER